FAHRRSSSSDGDSFANIPRKRESMLPYEQEQGGLTSFAVVGRLRLTSFAVVKRLAGMTATQD
ncbi:hypothetical protein ACFFJT_10975, partial [Dyella flava]